MTAPNVSAGNDTVYYHPENKLSWSNFIGPYEPTGNVAALTASGFGYRAAMHSKNGKGNITIYTYCFFSKPDSWVKPNRHTDYILSHEQHHFDISYIGMKLFMSKLSQANFTLQNYQSLLNKIYKESYQAMSDLQHRYDGETKNGQLPAKQAEWIDAIDDRLANLTGD